MHSCLSGLSPLESRFDFAGRFSRLEARAAAKKEESRQTELEKEELLLDIADYRREFQESAK